MSTNSSCLIIEVEPGKWYYVLEDYDAPKNAWDWREYAVVYGSFPTMETATKHLRNNHANPGGWNEQPFVEGYKPDEVMARLIAEAKKRNITNRRLFR